jgi:hypothetical protein
MAMRAAFLAFSLRFLLKRSLIRTFRPLFFVGRFGVMVSNASDGKRENHFSLFLGVARVGELNANINHLIPVFIFYLLPGRVFRHGNHEFIETGDYFTDDRIGVRIVRSAYSEIQFFQGQGPPFFLKIVAFHLDSFRFFLVLHGKLGRGMERNLTRVKKK